MSALWIVHREPEQRVGLTRLAGASAEALVGAPGDPPFDSAPPPELVVLGLSGDLEAELEFAHRTVSRLPESQWILIGEAGRLERARRLFDTLPAVFLAWPPQASRLRAAIRGATGPTPGEPLPLSARPGRDALAQRFTHGFGDLELPELLRALDPRLDRVPVLVLGESGTGRGTLARYVHHFGPGAGGALLELPCSSETTAAELLAELASASPGRGGRRSCTLWLEDADQLRPVLQRRVQGWIEHGVPPGALATRSIRWIATAAEAGLDPGLRHLLGGVTIHIPPLRERPGAVPNLAGGVAAAWCRARGQRPRRLAEDALLALEEYPWPGNLRELEAVIEQSLAASSADPLGQADLVLDGEPFAPGATALGSAGEEPPDHGLRTPDEWLPREPRPEPPQELQAPFEPTDRSGMNELEPDVPPEFSDEEVDETLAELGDEAPGESAGGARPGESAGGAARPGESAGGAARPGESAGGAARPGDLARLAASVGHELRNPLTAMRTFTELLPERHADPEFRERFGKLVGENLARIDGVLDRLEHLAGLPAPRRHAVDVGRLLEQLLGERRARIRERRLVVLEELGRDETPALADPDQLRFAFEAVLDRALELVPERGDVYIASRRHTSGADAAPGVRVLVRCRGTGHPAPTRRPDMAPAANAVEFAVADLVLRTQGGTLTLDTSDANETVILIDLQAS